MQKIKTHTNLQIHSKYEQTANKYWNHMKIREKQVQI